MRSLIALAVSLSLTGCLYTFNSLSRDKTGAYDDDYPASARLEQQRRHKRRRQSLIAGPIETVAGAGLVAASISLFRSDSRPPEKPSSGGISGEGLNRHAFDNEIGGAMFMAAGTPLLLVGLGDTFLGVTDHWTRSPLIRGDSLVEPGDIDSLAPVSGPLFSFRAGTTQGSRGIDAELGFAVAHWISNHARLQYELNGTIGLGWKSGEGVIGGYEGGLAAEVHLDYASKRAHAGTTPVDAIGIYAGGGWWRTDVNLMQVVDAPQIVGGLSLHAGITDLRVGTRFVPGVDDRPSFDAGLSFEFGGD